MVKIAHISDLHIVSNTATLQSVFWDFALLAGPPAAAMPFLKPYLEDAAKREELWRKLTRHAGSGEIDYRKVAAIAALSIPAALFLARQLVRLKRIFYLRRDSEAAREALYELLAARRIEDATLSLLRDLAITRPNQVWSTDITYIPIKKGWSYLVVVMDWYSRYVLAWKLSISMEVDFCIEALSDALARNNYSPKHKFSIFVKICF